ncbi:MAG: DUF3108 domain-containing protein [Dehalococcoidia bacterium]
MTLFRALVLVLAVTLPLAAAACAPDDGVDTQDVVTSIPWSAPEELHYRLTDDDGDRLGQAVLRIDRTGDAFALSQSTQDGDGNSDEWRVTVDAATLKPRAMARTILDAAADRRVVAEATYTTDEEGREIVRVKETNYSPAGSDEPDDIRSNPLRVPEHAYDNHASLFLWRTIPFEEGYTATYVTVFSNRRETRTLTLHVKGQEAVETPAGRFDAWLLEIEDGRETQRAWYSVEADRRLLVYDNANDQVLLLEE